MYLHAMAAIVDVKVPPEMHQPVTLVVDAASVDSDLKLDVAVYESDVKLDNPDLKITEDQSKKFVVELNPPKPDKYRVEVKFEDSEVEVSGSPLELNLSHPKAKSVVLKQGPSGRITAGQSISILFDTFPGGRGELTATCNGEDMGEIPVTIKREGISSLYTVTFLPPQEDEYHLSVFYSGKLLKGSPYRIDLIPVNPNKVECSKPTFSPNKPIEMDVCTQGAGNAKLTAHCTGKKSSDQVPVDIKALSKTNYHLSFDPPRQDVYTLAVLYGGKNIKNSPFTIDTVTFDASQVKITQPEAAKVGEPVCYIADVSLAGEGHLFAECSSERTGQISVEVTKENGKYKVHLNPEEHDTFVLKITWEGEDVPGSPFVYHMIPPTEPDKVKIGELHTPDIPGTDEDVWIEVDCSEAGPGVLSAECSRQNQANEEDEIPVSIQEYDLQKYQVRFDPQASDVYTLSLFFDGENIPEGSFEINLLPKSNSKMVQHIGTFIPDDRSEPVVLKFDASEAGHGEMRGRVTGISHAGLVSCTVEQVDESKGEYSISFVPSGADMYNVDVYWSNESIPGSPIDVKIIYSSEVVIKGPVDPQVFQPITIDIDTQYAGPGELTATCTGRSRGEVEVKISENEPTKYAIFFHPEEADFYSMRIFFNGTEVNQSPVEIDLEVAETIEQVEMIDLEVPRSPTPDNPGSPELPPTPDDPRSPELPDQEPDFIISTELQMTVGRALVLPLDSVFDNSSLTAIATGEKVGEEKVTIESTEEGSYKVSFNPRQADTYTISVKQYDHHVPGSPFIVKYMARMEDKAPTHPIMKPYLIQYLPESSVKDMLAYAIHDKSCTRNFLKVRKGKENTTYFILKAEKTGLHFIHIKQNSKEIHGSPFKLEIIESNPSACKLLEVPKRAYIGEEASFKVDASKAGTGDMHVLATVPPGGKGTEFSYVENPIGFFTITFTPKVAGKHEVIVKWAGVPIPGCPIPINVYNLSERVKQVRDAASRVKVIDSNHNVFDSKLLQSDGAFFYIATQQAGRGELTIKAKGPGDAKINMYRRRNAVYLCEVYPAISGKYDITILWNSFPIPGNPFQLDFTAEKTYIINEFDLESVGFHLKQPYEFSVDCSQNKGTLEVFAHPSDCAAIEVVPNEIIKGAYSVKITPRVVGNHEISIKFANRHILQSPYPVQFELPDKQDQEVQEDVNLQRLSGLDFPISLEDSEPEIREIPPELSNKEPGKVRASGPGLEGGVIGQEGNFIIETRDVGEGKLEVGVHGAKGTFKTNIRRHPDSDRTVLARYDPTNIGKYTIDILWCDKHIEGSPFVVNIKPQETETE